MSHQYDIIIPHYGKDELTGLCLSCLAAIRAHSSNYRLIFIDNGSPEFSLIEPELNLHPHLLIRNTENLGFVKATNQGLAMATAPFVVMLNNDTIVVEHWLEKLRQPLDDGAAHISGPRSSSALGWQGRVRIGNGYDVLPDRNMLAFFCTMFKKEVFDKVGFLDEDFKLGLGDDDWFCWKATRKGFKLALVVSLTIQHAHRSTFFKLHGPEETHKMQLEALEILRKKQLEYELSQ